jgi:hypothetical protein
MGQPRAALFDPSTNNFFDIQNMANFLLRLLYAP